MRTLLLAIVLGIIGTLGNAEEFKNENEYFTIPHPSKGIICLRNNFDTPDVEEHIITHRIDGNNEIELWRSSNGKGYGYARLKACVQTENEIGVLLIVRGNYAAIMRYDLKTKKSTFHIYPCKDLLDITVGSLTRIIRLELPDQIKVFEDGKIIETWKVNGERLIDSRGRVDNSNITESKWDELFNSSKK